jgi:hypothetical protein
MIQIIKVLKCDGEGCTAQLTGYHSYDDANTLTLGRQNGWVRFIGDRGLTDLCPDCHAAYARGLDGPGKAAA